MSISSYHQTASPLALPAQFGSWCPNPALSLVANREDKQHQGHWDAGGTEGKEKLHCEDVGYMWDRWHRDTDHGQLQDRPAWLWEKFRPCPPIALLFVFNGVRCKAEMGWALRLSSAVHFTGLTAGKFPWEIYCASIIFFLVCFLGKRNSYR